MARFAAAVVITPYRDSGRTAFEAVERRLQAALGERALRIDHVGSTSVPGLDAKDVIDVQVRCERLQTPIRSPTPDAAWRPRPATTRRRVRPATAQMVEAPVR